MTNMQYMVDFFSMLSGTMGNFGFRERIWLNVFLFNYATVYCYGYFKGIVSRDTVV
jgi:hypothetical protein